MRNIKESIKESFTANKGLKKMINEGKQNWVKPNTLHDLKVADNIKYNYGSGSKPVYKKMKVERANSDHIWLVLLNPKGKKDDSKLIHDSDLYNILICDNGVNENLGDKMFDKLNVLEPSKLRLEIVRFIKEMMEKTGMAKKNEGAYNDISVYNAKAYPKWAIDHIYYGNDKAEKLLVPFVKASKKLKDYSDVFNKENNKLFKVCSLNIYKEVKKLDLNSIIIDEMVGDKETLARFFIMVNKSQYEKAGIEYSEETIKSELNKIKPLLNNCKINVSDTSFYIDGLSKEFDKKNKEMLNKLNKKVLSNND